MRFLNSKSYVVMFSRENSKLCFELLEMLSAAQNNLPLRRGLKNLRSRFLQIKDKHFLVFIHFQPLFLSTSNAVDGNYPIAAILPSA